MIAKSDRVTRRTSAPSQVWMATLTKREPPISEDRRLVCIVLVARRLWPGHRSRCWLRHYNGERCVRVLPGGPDPDREKQRPSPQ